MTNVDMAAYGLLGQYAEAVQAYDKGFVIGRILSQEKGVYRLICEGGEHLAEVSGRRREIPEFYRPCAEKEIRKTGATFVTPV